MEELKGMVLVLLVEANVFGLLGCCVVDIPIEPQTSPLPLCPPVVSQWLMALSCDAYEYAGCPCALRGWFWSWKTTGGHNQVVRGSPGSPPFPWWYILSIPACCVGDVQ